MTAIIFDVETNSFQDPEIIEAAWAEIDNPESVTVTNSFYKRYKPSRPIEVSAMAIHHIIEADINDCPPSKEFRLPGGAEYLIGHNVDFDWRVIGCPEIKRIDTLALSRKLWPDLGAHSIAAIIYSLMPQQIAKEWLRGAHNAQDDVELCRVILSYIADQLNPKTWDDLWIQSESARIPDIMPFGKWKGTPIADVPMDYKLWLMRQSDVDPYLMKALKGEPA